MERLGAANIPYLRQQTIDTYDRSARELAEYFKGIGARTNDIDLAFKLAGNPEEARVLEIGCGDGRDASYINQRAGWYHGIDNSKSMITIARETVPNGSFEVADVADYEFPKNLDIIFSFASLLHLDREQVQDVLRTGYRALKPGGIFLISLKERCDFEMEVKDDKFGSRLFYFYNPDIICGLAGDNYELAAVQRTRIGQTDWFEVALQKKIR